MKSLFLLLTLPLLILSSNQTELSNNFSVKEIIHSLDKLPKKYIKLSDDSYIMYFLEEDEVKGVCRISTDSNKEFYVDIEDRIYLENGSVESFHDLIEVTYATDSCGTIISKNVGEILSSYYQFDQAKRLISYRADELNILFFNKGKFLTKVRSLDDRFEERTMFMVDKLVLGEATSFVLKDLKGNIILAVIDNVPYLTSIDQEGSLREIINIDTKQVVGSVTFSKNGHIAHMKGLTSMPYCFKGMYQEKISEIYFDVDTYYDADIGKTLF